MTTPRKPDNSDKAKGQELARLRKIVGMTQKQVAQSLGVSEKQYGKYERGESRLSAGRYETALKILREAGLGGFEETQSPYHSLPKPARDVLLQHLIEFESALKLTLDRLRLCFEILGRP